jgi:type II secretory pathway component PulF
MPTFAYRTIGRTGSGSGATIEAPDRGAALREIVRRGETPVSIEEASVAARVPRPQRAESVAAEATGGRAEAAASPGGASLFQGRVMSRVEMASLIRELATALQAGLPLVPALKTIQRQGRSDRQREMLEQVIADVERGKSLAESAARIGKPFNELLINMLRAGEASGKLPEVMVQAAELMDRDVKLRRSVLSATMYPMILLSLIVIAIIVVVTFIVPQVLKNVGASGQTMVLPMPTRVVQGIAGFFGGYWWLIIPSLAIGMMYFKKVYATPGPRLKIDRMLLRTPLLGRLLRDVAIARFTRTLGTLTSAGVPILQSLKITKGTLGNRAMELVVDDVVDEVAAGKTIAEPMEKSSYFPPMLVQIVNLGERSGKLDELLNQAAKAFEEKTEISVKVFTAALPPVLVVFAAMAVGFVVLAVLLPLLQLQDMVAGG